MMADSRANERLFCFSVICIVVVVVVIERIFGAINIITYA